MSAPLHAPVVDSQGRLTISLVDDPTVATSSTGTTTTLTYVSRLSTQDADMSTKITQKVEIGTNGIVGGVAGLSEFKGKLVREDVNTALLGLLTGKKQSGTSGVTTNWTYFDLANANFDYARLIADPQGAVYSAWVAMGCVLDGAQFDTKSTGEAQEQYSCMGPQLVNINAFPIAKNLAVTGSETADIASPYSVPDPNNSNTPSTARKEYNIGTTYGGSEAPMVVGQIPAANTPPNALYTTGRINFLSIKRILGVAALIQSQSYGVGQSFRYREVQPYMGACAGAATPGLLTFTLHPNVSTANAQVGPEIIVGSEVVIEPTGASAEVCAVTAKTSTTITVTTTQAHAVTGVCIGLEPKSGYCIYNSNTKKFRFGDELGTGDSIRALFSSFQTNSTPSQVGVTSLDTTSLPGVPGRDTPVTISAFQIPRVQSASIKVTISRKQVQGCGEDEIVYGTAGVPKIDYSLDVLKTDNQLLSLFSSGSTDMAAVGDVFPIDYIVRYQLANPQSFLVQIKNPNNNGQVIKSYTGTQPVFGTFSEAGSSEAELTQKFSGQDYAGALTISATTP